MARLGGTYKRWTLVWLFLIGLVLAVGVNASATQVAAEPVERPRGSRGGRRLGIGPGLGGHDEVRRLQGRVVGRRHNATSVSQLDDALLPIGWTDANRPESVGGWIIQVAGWLITAAMVTLGAPFWFGLLTKVVSLRATGAKPLAAAEILCLPPPRPQRPWRPM